LPSLRGGKSCPGKQANKDKTKGHHRAPYASGALRTGFLKKRRSYMATLRTRWENPDYTGVIAEVPIRDEVHP
jgi:hypothetical protein